jgi:hypothetical protein
MVRLPRLHPAVVLACSMAVPVLYAPSSPAWAAFVSAPVLPLLAQAADAGAADEAKADDAKADGAADAEAEGDAGADAEAQPAAQAEEGEADAEEADAEEGEAEGEEEADGEMAADEDAEADGDVAAEGGEDEAAADEGTEAAEGEEAAPAPVEAATAPDAPLLDVVEAFLHYGTLARYDVAGIEGKKILDSGAAPKDILEAFETAAGRRRVDRARGGGVDQMLLTFADDEATKDVSVKLMAVLNQARRDRMADPKFIDQAIQDLMVNERAYSRAVALLKQSGELAVPALVDYLRDPRRPEYHARIQRALVEMGRATLNPLVASLEMKDDDARVMILGVLSELGYESTAPYVADLLGRRDTSPAVREAATAALRNLGGNAANVGDQYHNLAEGFYAGSNPITSDKHYTNAFVWFWGNRGLDRKEVPHVVFDEVMAMRTAKRALELRSPRDSQSLWLAANYRREAQLPAGATDPTSPPDSAHFYGVDSGTRHLNAVLARALKDRDPAVALRAVKSLQDIVGRANLFAGEAGQPLIEGMRSPDRLVRFESAFAVAAALPQAEFSGRERVVPLLAEALSQTGTANVLVVAGSDDSRTRVAGALKAYGTAAATGAEAAIGEAAALPSVDVIVITQDLSDEDAARVLQVASETPRLDRAAKVVIRPVRATELERRNVRRKDVVFTDSEDGAALVKLVEAARNRAGGPPLDAAVAGEYALRAARLLNEIAKAGGGTVLEPRAAEQVLLNALADPRPEVAKEVAATLAWVNSELAQPAMLAVATDEKTPPDVRVAILKGLAGNAKNFGNRLQQPQFAAVQNVVQKGDSPELRNAAAEAAGALNLPGDQARRLILNWSVRGTPDAAAPAEGGQARQ